MYIEQLADVKIGSSFYLRNNSYCQIENLCMGVYSNVINNT